MGIACSTMCNLINNPHGPGLLESKCGEHIGIGLGLLTPNKTASTLPTLGKLLSLWKEVSFLLISHPSFPSHSSTKDPNSMESITTQPNPFKKNK